jgi:cephalosporin-C deacetylase-like acetyl esterase
MLYVELTQPNAAAIHVGAAVAPTRLRPSVARPADFDAFWAGKLQALSRVPMKPAVQKADSGRAGVELSTVQLQSVGSNVQAWLAKPERAGKLPALVIYQWAGVYAVNPNTALDRAAEGWLVLNVSSHDMPLTQATGAPPNYNAVGNSSREASYFLNMYLRDARAIDYITAHPEWDGKTLVLMGTSMGGQQSLVTAGLRNDKVTAVLVNEPSGADSNGDLNGSRAGYPNWNARDPKVMETALYFDVVNFAARIKAPVLAAVGYIDTTSPPAGIWRAMNQVPGRRDVIQMVESDHNNRTPEKQGEWNVRSKEWLDVLRTTTSAPQSR